MRINAYLALCKVCSRRKADEIISSGRVLINGKLALLGSHVEDGDKVTLDGKTLVPDNQFVYYVLNKPIGYLCTVSDDRGRPTVLNIVKDKEHKIFPVGRLDYNTQGLIILTNDGNFANKVIHPSSNIAKTYQFVTKGCPTSEQLGKLRKGIMVDNTLCKAKVNQPLKLENGYLTTITIYEGKNREIRKMCSAVGLHIIELKRIAIGNYSLGDLPTKKYRKVSLQDLQTVFEKESF